MATENEKFNSGKVREIMGKLGGYFDDFSTILKEADNDIKGAIQNGDNCAIKGNVGGRLLKLWEENSSNFQDFKNNFEVWSQTISLIYKNNTNFEVAADAIYRNNQ